MAATSSQRTRSSACSKTRTRTPCSAVDEVYNRVGDTMNDKDFRRAQQYGLRSRSRRYYPYKKRSADDQLAPPNTKSTLKPSANTTPTANTSNPSSSVINRDHLVFPRPLSPGTSAFQFELPGSETLLSMKVSANQNVRYTLENYREKIASLLSKIRRSDLLPLLNPDCFNDVELDPVEEYFSRNCSQTDAANGTSLHRKSARRREATPTKPINRTCVVKMRVRIQYKSHSHVLSQVESTKNGHIERQFDKYIQSIEIMRARDTGCVVCDITFTDVTYLGAFWRDYSNGALQEALKSVFLTEMMRQTAGDEELDLFVSVDEHDFRTGQKVLLDNLRMTCST